MTHHTSTDRTQTQALRNENLPATLCAIPQWLCWHYENRGGKRTKPPIDPHSNGKLRYAKSNDPSTWSDLHTAQATAKRLKLEGVGFCLSATDGLTGLDLDHVLGQTTGALAHIGCKNKARCHVRGNARGDQKGLASHLDYRDNGGAHKLAHDP